MIPGWWGSDKPYRITDVVEGLRSLPDEVVQCVVTSPPYWGLRDYGVGGQIGLEKTPEEYVQKLVEVFREVRRVLRKDGTLWLNLGDSYAGSGRGGNNPEYWPKHKMFGKEGYADGILGRPCSVPEGLKQKDLVGIPWHVAFALQAEGWYLRSDIIWAKPNPMPESVTDRPTKSHEYIFLLTKSPRYYYDAEAIKERGTIPAGTLAAKGSGEREGNRRPPEYKEYDGTRNKRSVWTITTKPYSEAHFATFPPELPELCIKAGTKPGDVVLDPFLGSGTTAEVARKLGRVGLGFELNPKYEPLISDRSMAEIAELETWF